jgi:cAMP-binding proteins - catabolite gene activator and regulatory subunit of cAMP-dependent protein kinases
MMEHRELVRQLEEVSIFESLSEKELSELIACSQLMTFKKDDVIIFESQEGNSVYVILEGMVKICRTNEEYKEVIWAILGEKEFFGEMSVLDGATRSADAVALSRVRVLRIDGKVFLEFIEKHPKLALSLLRELVTRLRKTDSQIKSISLADAVGKVASVIVRLAHDVGRVRKGRVEIENFASQQEIANYAATSRETISRVLTMFEREGLIERDVNKIIINNFEEFKQKFGE